MPFVLLAASLFAATSKVTGWLRSYLWMATGLALIELIDLSMGFGIASKMYGFMWALYNLAMLLFATAYARLSLRRVLPTVALISILAIFLSHPERWYLWLSGAKGAWCAILGISLLFGKSVVSRICGLYFLLVSLWQGAFTWYDGIDWASNWWLPSLLSVCAYTTIGITSRLYSSE